MPNPNAHDQPVEGGEEQIERALQKQSEQPPKPPGDPQNKAPKPNKKDVK